MTTKFKLLIITVVTPSLNKSFKFQSDWPYNNSQIYLLDSIIEDIKEDEERKFKLTDEGYEFISKVNYPNNKKLVTQEIEIDKKLNIKEVEVLDKDGNEQIKMTFNKIDMSPKFNKDYFNLSSILTQEEPSEDNTSKENPTNSNNEEKDQEQLDESKEQTESENESTEETKQTATIDDIIYPMYLPQNTYLTNQEKIQTESGERLILTFEGDNSFILVEETISKSEKDVIIPTSGELEFLTDVIGIVNERSVSWQSNGIEYYVASETLETSELIEIAKSISVLPVSK